MKPHTLKAALGRIVTAVVLAGLAGCAGSGIAKTPEALGLGEITFDIPEPERWELENGMTVLYYYVEELPLVRGKLYVPGGELTDYYGIAGLADATGDQIREGSIPGVTPDELDKRLDDLAASIESGFGAEYGTISFFSLTEDFDEVFDLFAKVARTPAFDEGRLALWKRLAGESIRRRRDDPDTMASMAFSELLYGKGSLFARSATYDSIELITRDKMQDFHRRFVRPDGAYLAISGAVPLREIQDAVDAKFGDWEPGELERPGLPEIEYEPQPGIYVLERDFDQAQVYLGHLGPNRHTEDIYAITIYNQVFGHGGFGSTLFKEIRSRLGLAYSVYGGLWPGAVKGLFQIGMGTRTTEVARAIEAALRLTDQSRTEPPTELEFTDAMSAVERSFVFKFAEPGFIVDRVAVLELLGYPEDYDERYLERLERVAQKDVLAAAKTWVHPEEFVIVVVGRVSAQELANSFKGKADVYRLDFDIQPKVIGPVLPNAGA